MSRIEMPHPLVTIGGLLVIGVLLALQLRSTDTNYGWFAIPFMILFPVVARWSVRRQRERHRRQLEQMRHQPVLHLNDE